MSERPLNAGEWSQRNHSHHQLAKARRIGTPFL